MEGTRQWANVQPVVHDNIHQLNQLIREHHARINELLEHTASLERNSIRLDAQFSARHHHAQPQSTPMEVSAGTTIQEARTTIQEAHFRLDRTHAVHGTSLLWWCHAKEVSQKPKRALQVDHMGFLRVEVAVAYAAATSRGPTVLVNGKSAPVSWTAAEVPTSSSVSSAACELGHCEPWCPHALKSADSSTKRCGACAATSATTYHGTLVVWLGPKSRVAVESLAGAPIDGFVRLAPC